MDSLAYLVAFQMPFLLGLGVWALNKVISQMSLDRHPRWAVNVATICIVYLILFFTLLILFFAH